MDSAVFDLNSGYRKRTIDMQNNERKEIRMRPLIASSDVHQAGLQSIPCLRSRNIVSISFLDLYSPRISEAVNGRFETNTNNPSRPVIMPFTALPAASSLSCPFNGNRYESLVSTKQLELRYFLRGLFPESMFFRIVCILSQSCSALLR